MILMSSNWFVIRNDFKRMGDLSTKSVFLYSADGEYSFELSYTSEHGFKLIFDNPQDELYFRLKYGDYI